MFEPPVPILRNLDQVVLRGTIAVYGSQIELTEHVSEQWSNFLLSYPELSPCAALYGASPCTDDGRIHYLCGTVETDFPARFATQRLTLEAGEYATVRVDEPALLRDTWTWLLAEWLPMSGRREKNAPEFERFSGLGTDDLPAGPIEIGIPLEPLT